MDTILKGDNPRIISAKFGWDWLSSFRGEDIFFNFIPPFTDFDRLCKLEKRGDEIKKNIFSSETTGPNGTKPGRKHLYKVLYKASSFRPIPPTNMAAKGNSCFWLANVKKIFSILRSTYPGILKLIWVPNLELLPFFSPVKFSKC